MKRFPCVPFSFNKGSFALMDGYTHYTLRGKDYYIEKQHWVLVESFDGGLLTVILPEGAEYQVNGVNLVADEKTRLQAPKKHFEEYQFIDSRETQGYFPPKEGNIGCLLFAQVRYVYKDRNNPLPNHYRLILQKQNEDILRLKCDEKEPLIKIMYDD